MNERADGQENSGGEKLWGIYHPDAEYSRQLEEPVRTVVTAVTKTAADEAGAELGFGDAEIRPVSAEEARGPMAATITPKSPAEVWRVDV